MRPGDGVPVHGISLCMLLQDKHNPEVPHYQRRFRDQSSKTEISLFILYVKGRFTFTLLSNTWLEDLDTW